MRLLLLMLTLTGCSPDWVDPMEVQPRAAPYRESPVYADGNAMQAPPLGTVAQEISQLPEAPVGDGGGVSGPNALRVSAAVLDLGEHQFEIVCAACHGALGNGISVVASKMALRTPPSLHEPRIRDLDDGQVFTAITDGYGLMPSFRARLSVEQRWAVVAYLRALQLSQSVPIGDLSSDDLNHLAAEDP